MAENGELQTPDVAMADDDNVVPAIDNIHNIPSDPTAPGQYSSVTLPEVSTENQVSIERLGHKTGV